MFEKGETFADVYRLEYLKTKFRRTPRIQLKILIDKNI